MELASYLFEEATRLLINPRSNMSRSKGWEPLGFYSKGVETIRWIGTGGTVDVRVGSGRGGF